MHLHILGICGTFMGGLALLARQAGHAVSGCDANVYPPMSTQLTEAGIDLYEGFSPAQLEPRPDVVVIGNIMARGNPLVEFILNEGLAYTSGPQWLKDNVLRDRWVMAVAGTHGKTTVASIVAWLLEYAGLTPGFLIGGIPRNFGVSARLGMAPFFVVEADEYDTAFFDKRSKFVHYSPSTLILNNLEFDHADIFADLAAIQRQFHHLLRTVPGRGLVVANGEDTNLDETLAMGCWTEIQRFGDYKVSADWRIQAVNTEATRFAVWHGHARLAEGEWWQPGTHNMINALAALIAARHAGVSVADSLSGLKGFAGVKRRLEVRGEYAGITLYDDFAHHPTEIRASINALRARLGQAGRQRLVAVLEPRSNTMRLGVHKDRLADALAAADWVLVHQTPALGWSLIEAMAPLGHRAVVLDSIEAIVEQLRSTLHCGDHVLIMSNGSFGGLHERLIQALDL